MSSILTAMLMVGLLSITRSSLQTSWQVDMLSASSASTLLISEQIEQDLQNSRGMTVGRNEIVLFGFLSRDSRGLPNYRTAYVGYRIAPAGLVRWQSNDLTARSNRTSQIIWAGATELKVRLDGLDDEEKPTNQELQLAGGLTPIAPWVSLTLGDRFGRRIVDLQMPHHQDVIQ